MLGSITGGVHPVSVARVLQVVDERERAGFWEDPPGEKIVLRTGYPVADTVISTHRVSRNEP